MVNSKDMNFYLKNMNHVMDLLNIKLNYVFLFVFYTLITSVVGILG